VVALGQRQRGPDLQEQIGWMLVCKCILRCTGMLVVDVNLEWHRAPPASVEGAWIASNARSER